MDEEQLHLYFHLNHMRALQAPCLSVLGGFYSSLILKRASCSVWVFIILSWRSHIQGVVMIILMLLFIGNIITNWQVENNESSALMSLSETSLWQSAAIVVNDDEKRNGRKVNWSHARMRYVLDLIWMCSGAATVTQSDIFSWVGSVRSSLASVTVQILMIIVDIFREGFLMWVASAARRSEDHQISVVAAWCLG